MNKLITIILTALFLFFSVVPTVSARVIPPAVSADSVVLLDATTGKILYEKNKDSAYPPASTTKIMTILLVLENSNLNDVVTVSKNAEIADGSKIFLVEGEKITVKELLYGLILASANDCAVALAEHVSGTTEKFVELMNKKAKSLGCTHTNFVNPNGLYNINHKTSAYDLSLIMQELTKYAQYTKIALTASYEIPPTNKSAKERPLLNGNRLIQKADQYYYPDCVGGKTGYTIQSKHSYIAVAIRNGQKLIVALVHDSKKTFFPDSRKLLDYGFDNFELFKQFNKNDAVSKLTLKDGTVIPLLASKDLFILKAKNSTLTPTVKIEENKTDLTSIKKGEVLGNAMISFAENSYTLDLTSGIDYNKMNPNIKVPLLKDNPTNSKTVIYIVIILAVLLAFISMKKIKTKKRRRLKRFIDKLNNKKRRF